MNKEYNPNDILREKTVECMRECKEKIKTYHCSNQWKYYYMVFEKHLERNGDDILSGLCYAMQEIKPADKAGMIFRKIFKTDFCSYIYEWDPKEQYDDCGKAIRNITYIKLTKEE